MTLRPQPYDVSDLTRRGRPIIGVLLDTANRRVLAARVWGVIGPASARRNREARGGVRDHGRGRGPARGRAQCRASTGRSRPRASASGHLLTQHREKAVSEEDGGITMGLSQDGNIA